MLLLFVAIAEFSMLTLDMRLACNHGETSTAGTRIGIKRHPEAPAPLLGVSRQRIN